MLEVCVLAVLVTYVALCPFNKVEESFNTQAIHDAWLLGIGQLEHWDHQTFPGTVPRTFVGALGLAWSSAASWPLGGRSLGQWLIGASNCGDHLLARQAWCRCVLGLYWACAFGHLARGVSTRFSNETMAWLCVLTLSQFHLAFYATRTLPNSLALVPTMWAYGDALRGRRTRALCVLVGATALFRCDLAAIVVPLGALWTFNVWDPERAALAQTVIGCAAASLAAILVSVAVDSSLWGKLTWPEGQVLAYNNPVDNRSAQWGVSPWHWYATSALPRALLTAYPLAIAGILREPRVRGLLGAACVSIILLSMLPHKELRFIFPSLPLFNTAAAVALAAPSTKKRIIAPRHRLYLVCLGLACVSANVAATVGIFARAAVHNYPGGLALRVLHDLSCHDARANRTLHVDVAAAVAGVSRFGELFRPSWRYDKSENIKDAAFYDRFDYRLALFQPRDDRDSLSRSNFLTIATIPAYAGFKFDLSLFPFLHVRTLPHLLVMRHRRHQDAHAEDGVADTAD